MTQSNSALSRTIYEFAIHRLGNGLIVPRTIVTGTGEVTCRDRLGGLLKFYCREAA